MCGIVGYIGTQKASPILLAGLAKLEYRGYDSAGIATMESDGIKIAKDKGRVENLNNLAETKSLEGTIGIAHTRWATHGIPSKVNSHPHMDNYETIAVVHNGIIENYIELRKFLEEKGYHFISDTDTEVIPNLINYFYTQNAKNDEISLLEAVKKTCDKLIGSFSLGILLENFEYVILTRNSINFYDKDLKEFQKESTLITWDAMAADKGGYEDYMLKEIMEQPTAIRETIGSRLENGKVNFDELGFTKEYLSSLNQIYLIACGTAMHAALGVKNTIEKICKIHTSVEIASEFRYRDPIVNEKTLCIFVSQSGETADTLAALKQSKEKHAKTISVTNVIGSSIAREGDYAIYTHAGPEIAVASTKAYTSQITLLTLFAVYCADILGIASKEELKSITDGLLELPSKIETVLKNTNQLKQIAKNIFKEKDVFYLGRGVDFYTAQEACLKLKEISYIHSESYAAGELKHGTIALIEKGINVIGVITEPTLVKKTVSNIEELVTRGAITTIVASENAISQMDSSIFNNVIQVPDTVTYLSPIVTVVPLQLLAYYVSKEKGLDVDKPRNLAKSVTVE